MVMLQYRTAITAEGRIKAPPTLLSPLFSGDGFQGRLVWRTTQENWGDLPWDCGHREDLG